MMMKFKVLFYSFLLLLGACSENGEVKFCVSQADGVISEQCGEKFTTGKFMVVVESKKPFGKEKVVIKLIDLQDDDQSPEEEIVVEVSADDTQASTEIEIYDSGRYRFVAETVDGEEVARGEVELLEE